jgi:hypothetical protein
LVETNHSRLSCITGIRTFFRENRLLLLILLVGFVFRLSGIFWGLPYIKYMRFYHPDESKIIDGAYEFPAHILTNLDLRYPTAFHYSLGILSFPLRLLPYPEDYYAIYLVGRVLSVLAGTAAILVVFLLARKIFDRRIALLAAFLLAFSMLHVANSAWATTDVMSSFLMALFLLVLLDTIESDTPSPRRAILTGVVLGLLVGVKYTGAIAIIPLVYIFICSHFRRDYDRHDSARSTGRAFTSFLRDRNLWIIGLVALGAFILSTPGLLRHPYAFIASLQYEGGRLSTTYLPLYDPETYRQLFRSLSRSMGIPLALAGVLGIVLAFFKRKDVLFALLFMLLVFALYFGSAVEDRYYLMVMPVLALFAGSFLFFLIDLGNLRSGSFASRAIENSRQPEYTQSAEYSQHAEYSQYSQYVAGTSWLSIAGYALAGLVFLYAFLYSLGGVVSRYPDSRTQAARYIAENVPRGASIGLGFASKDYEHSWHYPRIDSKIYEKRNFIKHPDYIVLSSYDYEQIRETLHRGILNPDYSLPRQYWREWYLSSPPTAEIFKLNEQLWLGENPEYCLLKKLLPRNLYAPIEFPPPTIEIYARQKIEGSPSPECEDK